MTSLFQWSLFANNQDTSNYTRSVETYPISSQPWVIVSLSGATSSIPPVKTPKVSIFAVDPIAAETARDSGQFMIALNAPTTKNIRVKFSIEGKATKGRDYQRFAPSLLIPAGNVSGIIEVLPVDDVQREGTEKVTLKLLRQGIKGYTVKGRSVANVGILDND